LRVLDKVVVLRKDPEPRGPAKEFIPLSGKERASALDNDAQERLLKEAAERAAHLEREGYDKGFLQGEKDGFELGLKKAEKTVEALHTLLRELSALKQDLVRSHEKELVNIVFAIAKKIVWDQGLRDESLIQRTALKALRLASERSEICLRVHPDDLRWIEKVKPEFFAEFKDLKHLVVTPDPSLDRGGCLLESPCGDVDGRIETQLQEVYQVIDEAFKEHTL
jgi:flagellar biosynthesis/type III secretory pathway protein FliH